MKRIFEFSNYGNKWDKRILPIKDLMSMDGSEQWFTLLVSPVDTWDSEEEFLRSLDMIWAGEPVINSRDRAYFDRLLSWLNDFLPKEVTIHPRYESERKVLANDGFCIAIMWVEHGRYYVYHWSSSA